MEKKCCTGCKALLTVDQFYRNKASADGLTTQCKGCCSARRNAWYQANKAKQQEYNRAYRQAHKAELNASERVYREAHKDKINTYARAYRQTHKAERQAYSKAWYQAHKAEQHAYMRAYREARKKRRMTATQEERRRQTVEAIHKWFEDSGALLRYQNDKAM